MWGALVFLALFLVIDPTTREIIVAMLEQARLRIAVEAPISYFLVIVLTGSAAVSALIMAYWPKRHNEQQQFVVTRRYIDPVEPAEWRRPRRSASPWVGLALELARYLLPVRVYSGFASLKRLF